MIASDENQKNESAGQARRKAVMTVLAPHRRGRDFRTVSAPSPCRHTRIYASPKTASLMVRGRIGGDGAAFNLGEAHSVARGGAAFDRRSRYRLHARAATGGRQR